MTDEIKALSMDSAPKDNTLVRLLVDYPGGGDHPLEDAEKAWTIGFNNFEDSEIDEWQFAGWSWSQDCFCEGKGRVIGWAPFHQDDRLHDAAAPMADGGDTPMTAAEEVLAWLLVEKIGVPDDVSYSPDQAQKIIADRLAQIPSPQTNVTGYPIEDEDLRYWRVWWQGSGPKRGDHIMLASRFDLGYEREIAYLGDQHHDEASALVHLHNIAVDKLRKALSVVTEDQSNG